MLYRISQANDWEQAQQTGFFASPDLAAEGFIHASELGQVLETARLYYANSPRALLLELDEEALLAAGVRVEREWAAGRQAWFPHVFGPVPLAAVCRVWPLPVAADGTAALPPALAVR